MPAEPSVLMSVPQSLSRSRASASLDLLRRLFRTRFGGVGLIILVVISSLSVFAPWFASSGPMDLGSPALQPPSWQHPLGTDSLGRDVRSVLLYAGRSSLTIGSCAAAMAFLIGGTIGALAGYFRGAAAAVLLRVTDLFHTLPAIIIVLFSVSLMGSSFWLQVAAVALAIWPIEARIVYGQFIALSEREFVLAARAVGLSTFHIIFREILPNALPTVIVQVSLDATIQYQVIQTLRRLNRERNLAMLIITHDLGMVAELCDQVYVMQGGRIVEAADVFTLFAAPQNAYTASLLAAAPR